MFKRKKKVILYFVSPKDDEENIVTVLDDKEQIQEYIRQRIILDNEPHYKAWAELHELDPLKEENKTEYVNQFLERTSDEDLEQYSFIVRGFEFSLPDLASILRMFSGCVPIGCSYEQPVEF